MKQVWRIKNLLNNMLYAGEDDATISWVTNKSKALEYSSEADAQEVADSLDEEVKVVQDSVAGNFLPLD